MRREREFGVWLDRPAAFASSFALAAARCRLGHVFDPRAWLAVVRAVVNRPSNQRSEGNELP